MNTWRSTLNCCRHAFWLVAIVVCGLVGCSQSGDGLVKRDVRGQVLINGKPYRGVIVKFHHTDPSVTGNAARPVAVTKDDGEFQLSTNGDKDGAVSGKYAVTFLWNDGVTMADFLRGQYAKLESTKFHVTIGESDEDLLPFELETTEENVKTAMSRMNQPAMNR